MRSPRIVPALLGLALAALGGPALVADPLAQDKQPLPREKGIPKEAQKAEKGAGPQAEGKADPVAEGEAQALKAAGLTPTGPGLLEFFHKRTQGKVEADQVAALIKQLGDKAPAARDKAAGELVGIGQAAVPLLRRAANELDDPDVSTRARQCLQHIEGGGGASFTASAVRSLAALRPPGTVAALVAYLPQAEDDHVAEEVTTALAGVALSDGKPDPALLKALEDAVPIRRSVAAEVLSQVGGAEQAPAVRKLLKDPKPAVRLRAALALAKMQDPEAVPVLISLLADLPPAQARPIEEFLANLAGEWAITVPQGNDAVARRLRRDLWTAWWGATDGPALLEVLKKHTPSEADREKIQALVQQLTDPSVAVRDKALADLLALGAAAVPFLRQAANDHESKASEPAQKALQHIDQSNVSPLPAVVARLLALRKPEGGAGAVLAYLPCAEDDVLAGELRTALTALAVRDGKADAAVVKALQDKAPARRAAAAEALCFAGATGERPAVRKLLQDADPGVRLRVALALGSTREKDAVPVLIALLAELPPSQAAQVEESLRALAGETAPDVSLTDDAAGRKKARDAWQAWWKKHGDKIDLAKLDNRMQTLGYTVVVEMFGNNFARGRAGRVLEFDRHGKVRWQIDNLMAPIDAQVLPGDRVLVCEQNAQRVSERDLKGKILWEKQINQPVCAQRLPNGHTFVVGRGQVFEFDRAGKEVFTYNRPTGFDILCGKKLRNGQFAIVTNQGMVVRLDSNGKELKTIHTPAMQMYNGYADVLPNDHVVVPMYGNNKVAEYDADGKEVWEASINLPISARRLANGHTLVTSANPQRVVELDRTGKVVWENKDPVNPTRADRR
jgi:HEAT repeat protein